MRSIFSKAFFVLGASLISGVALADLEVITVDESSLSYNLSPSNFQNSPENFVNSISNFQNSSSNYQNATENYENSSGNFENGVNGKRRLFGKISGAPRYLGYYVVAQNGTNNFFSPHGERLFYNPKAGIGVFSAQDGTFCGVLGQVNGSIGLGLTNQCTKLLMLSQ